MVGGISEIMRDAFETAVDDSFERTFYKGFNSIVDKDPVLRGLARVTKHTSSARGFAKGEASSIEEVLAKEKVEKARRTRPYKERARYEWILDDGMPYYTTTDPFPELSARKDVKKVGQMFYDSNNSLFLGKHPVRNSTRPQRFSRPSERFISYCYQRKEVFDFYEIPFDRCVVIRGCWHTNKFTLQRQMIPEFETELSKFPSMKLIRRFKRSMRNVIRKLQIITLTKPSKNSILRTSFNKDTYAGFHYENYLNLQRKQDVVLEAVQGASRRWDTLSKGGFSREDIFPSLYTIGARNKRDFSYDDGEVATSRVVHMPEFHVELVSGAWTDPITNYFKRKGSGPVFIGNSIVKYERLERSVAKSKFQIEGDWKRFDSTLYCTIIICAISILRCFYNLEDTEIDSHFLGMFDSVGIKDYYCPGGNIFRCLHGLPSGVKSTNLLGTIINLLALNFCLNDGSNKSFDFAAGGDDFVIFVRKIIKSVEKFLDKFSKRAEILGMRLKILEVKRGDSENLDDLPCFYKYVVKDGLPMIPVKAMLERVFMPWNKEYETNETILKFLFDVMPSLGHPATHLFPFYEFLTITFNEGNPNKVTINDIVRMHIRVFKKMMRKGVMPAKDESYFTKFSNSSMHIQKLIKSQNKIRYHKNFISVL